MNGIERIEQAAREFGWEPSHANGTLAQDARRRVFYAMSDPKNGVKLDLYITRAGAVQHAAYLPAVDGEPQSRIVIEGKGKVQRVLDVMSSEARMPGVTASVMRDDAGYQRKLANLRAKGLIPAENKEVNA